MCADPVLCFTVNGKRIYRHFSLVRDHSLILKKTLVFNCGKCLFCRKKKSLELAKRCVLHASLYLENCFLTLTYDEKKEGYHNELDYTDIQKFKKRLRSYCFRKDGRRIEIFNVHEYGRNGKKHWHLICFGFNPIDRVLYTTSNLLPLYTSGVLSRLWPFGFHTIGDVSEASAMYQAQYTQKDIKNGNCANGRKSKSNHSGIGKPYFLKHYKQILSLGFIPMDGKKMPIPRYFQKLAHKHYCHFYEPTAFMSGAERKAIHRPFKKDQPNKEIADLFLEFKKLRTEFIKELEIQWDDVISQYLTNKREPGFIIANKNALHDLKNRNTLERF